MSVRRIATLILIVGVCLSGCRDGNDDVPPGAIKLEIDRRNPEAILRFYFGGLSAADIDPLRSGLVTKTNGHFFVDPQLLEKEIAGRFDAPSPETIGEWDSLEAYFRRTYYEVRDVPETLEAAFEIHGIRDTDSFTLEVDGVMTNARRKTMVARGALEEAIYSYRRNGARLVYPTRTTFVGEHYLQTAAGDTLLAETTLMVKRPDGFWDYAVYNADGSLTGETQTAPKRLKVPTQCVGCHFGSRRFEPEKSFPAAAPDGPFGPRRLHVGDAAHNKEVVTLLNEHGKRSDTILGLYATVLASELLARAREEPLSPSEGALLDSLGITYRSDGNQD